MAKKITVVALCLLTLVGLFTIVNSLLNQIACEGQPINNNAEPTAEQQIFGERIIGQTFVAPRHQLNRIDIFFQTYQRKNTHDVHMRLLEQTDVADPLSFQGNEVVNITFNAGDIYDQSWKSFNFPAISNSNGKTYVIAFQSPSSKDGNAITVGGIERNSYLPGTAFLGPIPVPADIAFRSCYQMSVKEKLEVLAAQITHARPALWGDIKFYEVILLIYILLLTGFFGVLIRWVIT